MSFSGSRLTTTSALVHLFQYSAVMFSLSQTPFSAHSSLPEAAGPQTETRHAQHARSERPPGLSSCIQSILLEVHIPYGPAISIRNDCRSTAPAFDAICTALYPA